MRRTLTFICVTALTASTLFAQQRAMRSTTTRKATTVADQNQSPTMRAADEAVAITSFPYAQSFDTETLPTAAGWTLVDADKDGHNWLPLSERLNVIGLGDITAERSHSGANCIVSWSYYPTAKGEDGVQGEPLKTSDYLITPMIVFPADAPKPELSFFISSFDAEGKWLDNYKVLVSTTGTEVADFTDEVKATSKAPSDWDLVVIDLSKYKGKSIYVAFVHQDEDMYGLLLDDVKVGIDGTLSNRNVLANDANVSVVAKGQAIQVRGEGLGQIRVYDTMGRMVDSIAAQGSEAVLESSAYAQGLYIVRVATAHGQAVHKVMVR